MTKKHFIISIFVAILIHVIMLFYYFSVNKNNDGAKDQGENGLEVGVGIAGSFTDINKKTEDSKKSIKEEKVIEEKPKEIIEEEIIEKKITKEAVKKKPIEVIKKEIKEIQKKIIEKKVEKKLDKQIKKEVKDTKEKVIEEVNKAENRKPKELSIKKLKKAVATKELSADKSSKNTIESVKQGTGSQNQKTLGGNKGAIQSYLSVVKTKIARAKKYPRSARREGITGTATVSFTIKLNGKVKDVTLVKSSGDERLDEEALKMLKRASPFPAIPDDVSKKDMDLTIPIEFALKTIKNKFY